ncbi:hypothetical protein C8T65DRAFT_74280 [Cerioporus squamosus]|nr:hypothetical protein C8T65DRAFT_74280 [Cerioporus squamosus]
MSSVAAAIVQLVFCAARTAGQLTRGRLVSLPREGPAKDIGVVLELTRVLEHALQGSRGRSQSATSIIQPPMGLQQTLCLEMSYGDRVRTDCSGMNSMQTFHTGRLR